MTSFRIDPPIAFAHRGAKAQVRENTLEAFELGLKLGANGLESDVWLTADGVPVLDHGGQVRTGLRRKPIRQFARADLPPHIPSLADLYETCGANFELSLDLKDPEAIEAVVTAAKDAQERLGVPCEERLWLCHEPLEELVQWRDHYPTVKLVLSTSKDRMPIGPERCAADLAAAGLDAVNLKQSEWSLGLTTLFHRFEITTFGWDAQYRRTIDALLRMEIDGVYSDHVDLLTDAYQERYGAAPIDL